MRLQTTTLVVPDGSGRLVVRSSAWDVVRGSDLTIPVRVVHQDGSAYDLSGAVASVLAFMDIDGSRDLQVEWTITDDAAGLAEFYVTRDMWGLILEDQYATGVQFRDDDTEVEDTTLLAGRIEIAPQIATFAESVTVPPSQTPLARGPQGPSIAHVADFASLPDVAASAWLFCSTDDDSALYFSNGVVWILLWAP